MENVAHNFKWLHRYGVILIFTSLFLFMALVMRQQDRTIQSQRELIRQLFRDTLELNHLKNGRIASAR